MDEEYDDTELGRIADERIQSFQADSSQVKESCFGCLLHRHHHFNHKYHHGHHHYSFNHESWQSINAICNLFMAIIMIILSIRLLASSTT